MFAALIRLVTTQPVWVAGHAEAYVDLVTAEMSAATAQWQRRALLWLLAVCSLMVAVMLAGVATMLAVLSPEINRAASWALLLTPLVPLVASALCVLSARNGGPQGALAGVREQLRADMVMLREMSPG
jgi:hypothetical protein